jgi:hypothetical protein
VLGALEADALDPRIVAAVIDMVFAQLTPANAESTVAALRRNLRVLDGKIANLTAAVESGAALEPLIAQLHDRQQERERLIAAIGAAQAVDQIHIDRAAIEARVPAQVANWRALLTESVEDGRTLLREVLSGPLVFTPEGEGYHFRAPVATGELIAGAVSEGAQQVASPRGGAEMGGAHKVASPMPASWNQIAFWLHQIDGASSRERERLHHSFVLLLYCLNDILWDSPEVFRRIGDHEFVQAHDRVNTSGRRCRSRYGVHPSHERREIVLPSGSRAAACRA